MQPQSITSPRSCQRCGQPLQKRQKKYCSANCVRSRQGGASTSPEYHVWEAMKQRCHNPRHKFYSYYGGRGIAVAPTWHRFENFIADMGRRPSPLHSIDRIDNDGNYEPGNCRWAVKPEQQRNMRSNVHITIDGRTATLAEWCVKNGIDQGVASARIRHSGWSPQDAVTVPVAPRRKIKRQKISACAQTGG